MFENIKYILREHNMHKNVQKYIYLHRKLNIKYIISMKQLSENSSNVELREYFAFVFSESREPNSFPADLDVLWPIAYKRKSSAVRELKLHFPEGEYYIVKKAAEHGCQPDGRMLDKYYLSLVGFEFFIIRHSRKIWELLKSYMPIGLGFLEVEPFYKILALRTRYILHKKSSIDEIVEYIGDMYGEHKNGNKFPICLSEVHHLVFDNSFDAFKALTTETELGAFIEGTNYRIERDGAKKVYHLSIECFGWLIGKQSQLVQDAFRIAIEKGLYPDKPLFLKALDKASKRLSKV